MSLSKRAEDLIARVREVNPYLEKLIADKKIVPSKAVAAPFGSHNSTAEEGGSHTEYPPFREAPWTDWTDTDNY
jgi:hypothetical protein